MADPIHGKSHDAHATEQDRRKCNVPIPDDLQQVLNSTQRQALTGITYSGWEPRFLRRPMFQDPVLILHHPGEGRVAVLDTDGRLQIQSDGRVREGDSGVSMPDPDAPLIWT